ncbi:MAG: hypothetical protein JW881_11310 [Spirochaetales bacterium]|nr:hypothetical protein [Spirochaetales bacterium]
MQKMITVLLLLISAYTTISGQAPEAEEYCLFNSEKGYCEYDVRLILGEDYIVIPDYNRSTYELTGTRRYPCRIVTEDSIPFLLYGEHMKDGFVVLRNHGYILLYEKDGRLFFEGADPETPEETFDMVGADYSATSFLEEAVGGRHVSYIPENCGIYGFLEQPWVNAGNRYGTGEKLTVIFEKPVYRLCFSNGYVSGLKPDLYAANSRVKKISIEDLETHERKAFDIEDTPDIRMIRLPRVTTSLAITILEVYEGTRYKDTCINFVLGERYEAPYLGPQGCDVTTGEE